MLAKKFTLFKWKFDFVFLLEFYLMVDCILFFTILRWMLKKIEISKNNLFENKISYEKIILRFRFIIFSPRITYFLVIHQL